MNSIRSSFVSDHNFLHVINIPTIIFVRFTSFLAIQNINQHIFISLLLLDIITLINSSPPINQLVIRSYTISIHQVYPILTITISLTLANQTIDWVDLAHHHRVHHHRIHLAHHHRVHHLKLHHL